ncbi:hypothetical protein [Microvirga arabica]|uniref:hypothetical protein n=1 Tax=Microvirga arabica TaxID=1128671 RepID=UPI00193A48EF|nr:hypothetical protein [Microvirga arabica]MBM1171286.1 hypothetical protein [Microvirga arabica]
MTTATRQAANRANARQSTGPRTVAGKARSRLNALRHGLAVPTAAMPEWTATVAALTDAIVGANPTDAAIRTAAMQVAESTVDLVRVRTAQLILLERIARHGETSPQDAGSQAPPERPTRLKVSMATRVKAFRDGTRGVTPSGVGADCCRPAVRG